MKQARSYAPSNLARMAHGRPWIGVGLDGTLACDTGPKGKCHIGEPIPRMVERVRGWRDQGVEVRIVTARISRLNSKDSRLVRNIITQWSLEHIGEALPITCKKDSEMIELWDDRCVQVIPNTGARADESEVLTSG